jgi:hypothetical protein
MATANALASLLTARDQAAANIAAATVSPKPDYGVDGQSVSWSAYVAGQAKLVDDLNKLIATMQPYRIVSVAR